MAQTTVTFRMDEDLKREFDELCETLGMTMSATFIVFAKQMVREQRIPFSISADPYYNDANIKAIIESVAQINAGKSVNKDLKELEELANG